MSISLNQDQSTVLQAILEWLKNPHRYLAVGGYAGTGKTTLIAYFRKELAKGKSKYKKVAFCCYTGKAASVLRSKLKEADALLPTDSCTTIHSLIYTPIIDDDGSIKRWDKQTGLDADLIVIDEGSMVNELIWGDLLSYHRPILIFGDHGQLPPIEGRFNLMASPHLLLNKIVRQAEDNPIIQLSAQIRAGESIPMGKSGHSIQKYDMSDESSWEVFADLILSSGDDYLCVCGLNRTRVALNTKIRELKGFEGTSPKKGDRVICLKNNYLKMIFNGMLGEVLEMREKPAHWYKARIAMEDGLGPFEGKILRKQFGAMKTFRGGVEVGLPISEKEYGDLFDFGYAVTAHKAQGSEAKRVIVFEERIFNYDDEMWRRWLYTAVTRAKEELYVFGRG